MSRCDSRCDDCLSAGDGGADAIMTRASLTQGASVLALGRTEGRWEFLALERPIGRPQRWEHTIGVAASIVVAHWNR